MPSKQSATGIPYKKTGSGITIEVKVEPGSSQTGIAGLMDDHVLKVKLTCPPVKGAANDQLIGVLAEALSLRKSHIKVIRGRSSKRKVVLISGIEEIS